MRNARDFPLFSTSQFFLSPKVEKLRKTQKLINRHAWPEIWQMPFREIDVYSGRRLWMDYINIIIRCFFLYTSKKSRMRTRILTAQFFVECIAADDVITSRAGWRIDHRCTRFDDLLKVFLYETFAIMRHFSNCGSEAFSSLTHDNRKSICMLLSQMNHLELSGEDVFFALSVWLKAKINPE